MSDCFHPRSALGTTVYISQALSFFDWAVTLLDFWHGAGDHVLLNVAANLLVVSASCLAGCSSK